MPDAAKASGTTAPGTSSSRRQQRPEQIGKAAWEAARQQWRQHSIHPMQPTAYSSDSSGSLDSLDRFGPSKLSEDMRLDLWQGLNTGQPFKHPVSLTDMVYFLDDAWCTDPE